MRATGADVPDSLASRHFFIIDFAFELVEVISNADELCAEGISFYAMCGDIALLLSKLLDGGGFINHMG